MLNVQQNVNLCWFPHLHESPCILKMASPIIYHFLIFVSVWIGFSVLPITAFSARNINMKNEYLSAVQGCLSGDKGEWREGCLCGLGRVQGNWILTKCVLDLIQLQVFFLFQFQYLHGNKFWWISFRRLLSWVFFPFKKSYFYSNFLHVGVNALC